MSKQYFLLGDTNAARANMVRLIFFRPPALALYIIILAPFLMKAAVEPLGVALGLLLGFLWIMRCLMHTLAENIAVEESDNVADQLSFHMVQHLSAKISVSAETMLEAATESKRGLFILHLIGVERADVLRAWKAGTSTIDLETALHWGLEAMAELKTLRLDSTATIYAFFKNLPELTSLLNTADLSIEDVRAILKAEVFHYYWSKRRSHPWSPEALVKSLGAMGKSWIVGYNTELERLTTNISDTALHDARDTAIHEEDIRNVQRTLAGGQKNILIIGKPGSGRRTLTRNIAAALRKHELERGTAFTDVLKLKTTELLSGSARGDTELLNALKKAVESGMFIIVIEDLALLLEGSDARLRDVLMMLLQAKNLRTIGIVETSDYHMRIKTNPALDTQFEKIALSDATEEETMAVLLEEYFILARKYSVRMTYKAIKLIVELSSRFINREALPGKALAVLRESILTARAKGLKTVTAEQVRDIVSVHARVDVRELTEGDRTKLLELEQRLQSRIVGHTEALRSIVAALKRARLDLGTRQRPIGTFLFLGTTGVGKTETAKALAEEYFGTTESFIRVDMNECSDEAAIHTLIGGGGPGGFAEGFLTKRVQDRPFSLLLLDEVEKAHPKVLHLFLQILDEGMLIDGNGVSTDFRNTIIIATSNAGVRWISEHPAPQEEAKKQAYRAALIDTVIEEKAFSPEFMNRFDEAILFDPPTPKEIEQIAVRMLDDIISDTVKKRGIRIIVEPAVLSLLAERGFSQEFGARELRRVITRSVETYLADYLLKNNVKRGDEITIHLEDIR